MKEKLFACCFVGLILLRIQSGRDEKLKFAAQTELCSCQLVNLICTITITALWHFLREKYSPARQSLLILWIDSNLVRVCFLWLEAGLEVDPGGNHLEGSFWMSYLSVVCWYKVRLVRSIHYHDTTNRTVLGPGPGLGVADVGQCPHSRHCGREDSPNTSWCLPFIVNISTTGRTRLQFGSGWFVDRKWSTVHWIYSQIIFILQWL